MAKIQVIQYPGLIKGATISPPCWKAQLTLRFKGLDYEVIDVILPAQIKKHNPRGRVPAIKDGGEIIVDSSDIITYLDKKYPEPPLDSKDPKERAMIRVLEDWADENLYFYAVYLRWLVPANFKRLKTCFFNEHYPPLVKIVAPAIARKEVGGRARTQGVALKGEAVVRKELYECFEAIDAMLEGQDYLVGSALSRADISVFAIIDQLSEERLTPDVRKEIDKFQNISQWRALMTEKAWGLSRAQSDS
ncbi:MAG: glutathione S-transferase family protein [Planctomycetota bacterium]|nr:glutathione S-transferase family protein [Planctomycetota bacterium]